MMSTSQSHQKWGDYLTTGAFAARAPLPTRAELKNMYRDEEFSFDDEY